MNPAEADRFNTQDSRIAALHISELSRYYQASHNGLAVDGKCGKDTRAHLEAARVRRTEEELTPVEAIALRSQVWKAFDGPLDRLPRNRREVYDIYKNPGAGKVNRDWKKKHLVTVRDLPGVPWKWFVKLHRLVEPYAREGLRRAAIADPDYKITRFGAFVFRHIRHDSTKPLSRHAFGCAFDINAKQNRGKSFKRGEAPKAWSPEWMQIWPDGITRPFVEALQSVGFAWGSDWDEDGVTDDHVYLDPMHFELVHRGGQLHRV